MPTQADKILARRITRAIVEAIEGKGPKDQRIMANLRSIALGIIVSQRKK